MPKLISIHAPTRGATKRRDFSRHVKNFNPRSHKGSDANPDPKFLAFSYFNPRSHKGSDKLDEDINGEHEISIHAPTRGATAVPYKMPRLATDFNPRSHKGSDDLYQE